MGKKILLKYEFMKKKKKQIPKQYPTCQPASVSLHPYHHLKMLQTFMVASVYTSLKEIQST